MKNWNLLAEVLGFVSGCLLLWPAIFQNIALRNIFITARRFSSSKTGLGKTMSQSASLQAPRAQWSRFDQWLLTLGAATLVLSFLIKVVVVL